MTSTLETATKLSEIKDEINHKLKLIAGTLDKKYSIEQESQEMIKNQLNEMTSRVDLLEKQSQSFEKRLHEQQIKSMQDALTKLSNRAAFDDYFALQMVRFHHKPFELAIVILDLDDFKRINDTYGHTAGDKTLQVIANTLTKHTLKDTFIGRYGGEEFVLIYSNINKDALIKELNILKSKIARLPFTFKNNKVSITASIGASHITPDDNIHLAFERADEAMYQAKSKGKNQVIYF
jgi:diguanylate cyclase (GGDEF)-like protein